MNRVQQTVDSAPSWFNWIGIVGAAALAWIQPIAGLVAIVWGCLQIYSWCEKRWHRGDRDRRKQGR